MKQINDRIKELRTIFKLSQTDFSKRIYVSQTFYSDIEVGNTKVNDRIIELISSKFNVNKDWIKTGNGEMFNDSPPDIELEKLIEIYNELPQSFRDCLLEVSSSLLKTHRINIDNEKGRV
jgi:transcriptional regulator with XRE-family HTH domain